MSKDPKPTHWRSLAELESDSSFHESLAVEFAEPVEELAGNSASRRGFLQIMGASMALAGATTGCRWEKDEILPLTQRPDGIVPGEPRHYSTSIELDGVGCGVLVTSIDGRPIKVDGNPRHPESLGRATIYQQACILDLYDPDRSQDVVVRKGARRVGSWEEFSTWATKELSSRRAAAGQGLAFLFETTSSPTVERLRGELKAAFPASLWANWSVNNRDESLAGSVLALGQPYRPIVDFSKARIVLSVDADPLSAATPRALVAARSLAGSREPDANIPMNRIYAVESSFSLLGTVADHRLALRSTDIGAVLAELDALISEKLGGNLGAAQPKPGRPWMEQPKVRSFIDALLADLLAARGDSIIVVGERQPAGIHAIAHRLNALLGNVGRTVRYVQEPQGTGIASGETQQLTALVAAMKQGAVQTLVILGGNPAWTAPADLGFADALGKVTDSVHLAFYEDETSQACSWHLPQAHALESWGDALAFDGTVSLAQPMIQPLYGGKTSAELLALLLTGIQPKGYDLLRATHASLSEPALRQAIRDGILAGSALPDRAPTLNALPAIALADQGVAPDALELVLTATANLHDGRFANNAWLVELPDPITKVTWDNAALFAPKTAADLGIRDGEQAQLMLNGQSLAVTAVIAPGQAERSIRLALGWGRTAAGRVGGARLQNVESVGTNAYGIRSASNPFVLPGLTVQKTGIKRLVASTQDLHAIDQRGREGADSRLSMIVREADLEQYQAKPNFAREVVHHPPLLQMWNSPTSYEGHRWAMSVDLNKCIGCNACMVACQAENNVPVVGKADVARGREMHWIRIDRYYAGTPDDPRVSFQPMLCQHCENAPCEQVCPVGATMHSSEGLNDMTYNRCIGTRYCSNNCPYKVRRFNYFNYHLDLKEPDQQIRKMVYNPDVTVRFRGVMEKCTFCVQRIQRAKIYAKNDKRPLKDGEITTACQQTCPTDAIVFGDLNDRNSRVTHLHEKSRSYAVLEELNNRPRIQYLARIRNPNSKLV